MTFTEAIKDGFRVMNRNWQLVLIQVGMAVVSGLGFFIVVGIPLAIAFILFGIDLTELTDVRDVFRIFKGPSEILSKYLGIFLIVVSSFFLYLIMVTTIGLYVFAGSVGVLGKAIKDSAAKFNMHLFFREAKRLFFRLLVFTTVIGTIFIIAAFSLGILGGGIAALVSFAQSQDSTLALFFGIFFSLILIIISIILILGILSVTLYGIASLCFKDTGPLKSIKEATHYLMKYSNAFWLYVILFGGYLIASFLLILLSYPFTFLPIIGPIFSFPFHLFSYAFETYLGLGIIATILTYYYSTEIFTPPVTDNTPPQSPSLEETVPADADVSLSEGEVKDKAESENQS